MQQDTVVYLDGAVSRRVEIHGRQSDGQLPAEPGWLLDRVGLRLAEPDVWQIDEPGPGRLSAEGTFAGVDQLPPTLIHRADDGWVRDTGHVKLTETDLGVARLWEYQEQLGDPFGALDLAQSLEELTELAIELLREELRLELGSAIDSAPAERFLRGEARLAVGELLSLIKLHPGRRQAAQRQTAILEVLERYGIAPPELSDDADWGETLGALVEPVLSWTRQRTAAVLSPAESELTAEDLPFWPTRESLETSADDDDALLDPRIRRVQDLALELILAIEGFYGDLSNGRFRFESSVELPGTLLTTNGTPVDGGATWLYRGEDLRNGVTLAVRSIELDTERLARLGARRDLPLEPLLRLVDLLTDEEHGEASVELVTAAIEASDLCLLDESDEATELPGAIRRELRRVLDPDRPFWPPTRRR